MNRRRFLLASSAAATLAPTTMCAQNSASQQCSPNQLPSAIAALTDRSHEAVAITTTEREQRTQRAQQLMSQNKVAAILVTPGTSLAYFTGIRTWDSERLFAWLLPATGDAFIVCPVFEEDRMREWQPMLPGGQSVKFHTWNEDEDPFALTADTLRSAGITTGSLALDEHTQFTFADALAHHLPAMQIVSGRSVISGCRSIKSPAELALMQLANDITWHVYEALWKSLAPGMTTAQARDLIAQAYGRCGVRGEASVEVDQYSALPHGSEKPQTLRDGSIVMVDDGCTVDGYQSDITRTWSVGGHATDRQKQVFDVVRRAQLAAIAAAHPGVPCEAIDAAARKVVDDAGFGPGYAHFGHRVGHGIGMDGHEQPYLVRGNRVPLAAGMTFSDEPGIYLRGEFGVRLEDDWVVTESGGRMFTPTSHSIDQPFAT